MEENEVMINEREPQAVDLKKAKRGFSTLALGCFVMLALASLVQILLGALVSVKFPDFLSNPYGIWAVTFLPLYVIAVPVGLLIMRKVPKAEFKARSFGAKNYIAAFFVAYFMMYLGNYVGTMLTNLISASSGNEVVNPIMNLATQESVPMKILVIAVIAPIVEEFIFRRTLIDRLRVYGERLAVVWSSVVFALFHGNLSQGFYAFTIGLVLGYVYLRTGKLRYSVFIHMFINFMGSIVSVALLNGMDIDALNSADIEALMSPGLIGFGIYVLFALAAAIVGLILLLTKKKQITFEKAPEQLPKGKAFSTAYLNVGMLLLFLSFAALTVTTIISM